MTRLSGKVALITGGGTGIGRAIALAFAREGASVAVAGRRLEKLREVISEIQKQGGAGLAMECDVTRAREVERAVKGTVERFGRLNVLVNNAGAVHVSTVEGISEEDWDRLMTVNVKGPFLMSRAVLPEFRKCSGGAIVNIGSVLGMFAVKGTVERFGRLNVLVNNAGTLHVSTVEGISEEEWDRMMTVNVKGPFLMSRAVLPEFRKCGGGTIVNIGSVLGLFAVKDRAAYSASKGAVTMLTKSMALDHAHEKIRVNCICPSVVETDLVKGVFNETERGQEMLKARLATIPLGRLGRPEDVAEMAVFLASEESSWLTGVAIPLDGGVTAS